MQTYLNSLAADGDDAIIAVDHTYAITFMNGAAERLYRVSAAQVVGRPLKDLYDYRWLRPEDEVEAFETLARVGVWSGRNIHLLHDGTSIEVESVVRLFNTPNGPSGLVAVMREVLPQPAA